MARLGNIALPTEPPRLAAVSVETCATPPPTPLTTSTPAPTQTPEPTSSATPTATVMPALSRTHVNAYLHPRCCPHHTNVRFRMRQTRNLAAIYLPHSGTTVRIYKTNRPELPKHPIAKWHPYRTRPTPRLRRRLDELPHELHSHGRPHRNHHSSQTTKAQSPSKPASKDDLPRAARLTPTSS